jgi:hypothetical protein
VHTGEPPARSLFTGQNPPTGAVIYYYLKQAPKQEVKLEILDASGNVIVFPAPRLNARGAA